MTRLRKKPSTGDAFLQLGLRYRAQISEHEVGAMRRDVESLHKMRVDVRRLRSLFTNFKQALVAEDVRDLRRELRWLQRILGDCRDWDVFNAENVMPLRDRLAEHDRLQRFAELGAQARERAYDKLEQVAGTKRYRAAYERLDAVLNHPGQALIDDLQPRKGPDRKVLDAAHDMVTGWMMAKSAGCREQLEGAWERYRSLKRLG
jgi:CHAD domain-containing protein